MTFSPIAIVLPMVREGNLRALAVTSLKRSSAFPDVPTIAESRYPGFEVSLWYGLLAPARTPATIVRRLHLETAKALALPDLRVKLGDLGLEGIGNLPDEFAAVIKSEIPKVLELLAQGLDNGTIGTRLHISERTARNHVSAILGKLGINTRSQAIVRAREAGFGGQKVR